MSARPSTPISRARSAWIDRSNGLARSSSSRDSSSRALVVRLDGRTTPRELETGDRSVVRAGRDERVLRRGIEVEALLLTEELARLAPVEPADDVEAEVGLFGGRPSGATVVVSSTSQPSPDRARKRRPASTTRTPDARSWMSSRMRNVTSTAGIRAFAEGTLDSSSQVSRMRTTGRSRSWTSSANEPTRARNSGVSTPATGSPGWPPVASCAWSATASSRIVRTSRSALVDSAYDSSSPTSASISSPGRRTG